MNLKMKGMILNDTINLRQINTISQEKEDE